MKITNRKKVYLNPFTIVPPKRVKSLPPAKARKDQAISALFSGYKPPVLKKKKKK